MNQQSLETPLDAPGALVTEGQFVERGNTRDLRAKRPPLVAVMFNRSQIQRLANGLVLAALDLLLLYGALMIALLVKSQVIDGELKLQSASDYAVEVLPFAALVMLLLFLRDGLYRPHYLRPGSASILGSLFKVTLVTLAFALIEGERFNSYYIFWSTFLVASVLIISARFSYDRLAERLERAFGHVRRAVIVGSNDQIDDVATALSKGAQRARRTRRLHLARAAARQRPAQPRQARIDRRPLRRDRRGDHRRPVLPGRSRRRPRRPLPPRRRQPARRAQHDGHPLRRAHRVRRRREPAAVRAQAAGLRRHRLRRQARSSTSSSRPSRCCCFSPLLDRGRAGREADQQRAGVVRSPRPGLGGESFDCFKFRTMQENADALQEELEELNEADGALFKIKSRPTPDAGRRLPAQVVARRTAAAAQRAARRDDAWSARARCPSATTSGSRTGTRSATWCCPA